MEQNEVINKCLDFLKRSSKRYSAEINAQSTDLNRYNGNFWSDELKKDYHRTSKRKLNLHFSDWSVLANAIASPFGDSPWHVNLSNREGANESLQESINVIEQDNDSKFVLKQAFHRGIVAGAGFIVVTTDLDRFTNVPKVVVEFVQRQDSIALDPDIETVDGSDAEEGAIVNYISINKAKRLYGEDVLPFDYPNALPKLNFTGISQWGNETGKIQIVSYYVKEGSRVMYYKICGNKVIESLELPIKYIPIIRFAGYQKYCSDGLKYSGIVDKTFDLQLGLNMAYSTLMERANRSIKANLIASTDAVEGLDQYYKKMSDEDGLMILHNKGTQAPTPIIEQFNTGDLSDVINNTRMLIADVIGVPLSGINGINSKEQTATEILIQQNNRQSNVCVFYDNAYRATRTISRILIEFLNEGNDVLFDLENGPDVINQNLKRRQELQAVASLVPTEMQSLLAVHMLDTMDSEYSKSIKNDIIANLPENIQITKPAEDPVAIHQLEQMKQLLDQTMQELENSKMALAESEKQYEALNIAYQNRKEETMINYQKWQSEMELKQAELLLKSKEQDTKTQLDIQKAIDEQKKNEAELQKEVLEIEEKKMDLTEKAIETAVEGEMLL